MRKPLLCLLAMGILSATIAQENAIKYPNKKRSTLGFQFTLHDFKTAADLNNTSISRVLDQNQWHNLSRMNSGLAISYLQGLTDYIEFMARLGISSVTYPVPAKTASEEAVLWESDANLLFKLLNDHFWMTPFASVGAGVSKWKGYYGAYLPLGLGLEVNLNDGSYLMLSSAYRVAATSGTTANHLFYSLGIGVPLGQNKPVAIAPPPPPPPAVELPKDSDHDGIIDSLDACPDVAGVAKFNGCPDTDSDGIPDKDDKCPNVAGLEKYQGCPIPDTDGDGINDEKDKCPTVAGLERYQGCPIPDTDGDGVNDEEDKCPEIAGTAQFNGCPPVIFEAKNIQFLTGSATILKASNVHLDKVVSYLKETPEAKIDVNGYTDNTGKDAANLKLSQRRAEAVKAYFVKKGIAADRIGTQGFGASDPIADNNTKEGRAQNRRTEFSFHR